MLESLTEFLSTYLLPYLAAMFGEESVITALLTNNPLLLFVLVLVPILILWGIAIFFDFIKDSWKMPFGIILDLLAIFLFPVYPWAVLGLAALTGMTFFLLSGGGKTQHWIYLSLGFLRMLVIAPFFPVPDNIKALLVLIPACTVLMFFLCITD